MNSCSDDDGFNAPSGTVILDVEWRCCMKKTGKPLPIIKNNQAAIFLELGMPIPVILFKHFTLTAASVFCFSNILE